MNNNPQSQEGVQIQAQINVSNEQQQAAYLAQQEALQSQKIQLEQMEKNRTEQIQVQQQMNVQYAHQQNMYPQQNIYPQQNMHPQQNKHAQAIQQNPQYFVQGTSTVDSLNTSANNQLNIPLNVVVVQQQVSLEVIQVVQLLEEDETVKVLLCGPNKIRPFTDIWAGAIFGAAFTIFIVLGIVSFARSHPFSDSSSSEISPHAYGVGFGAVFTTFVITFLLGLSLQVLLMRFTFYILMSCLIFGLILLTVITIYFFAKSVIVLAVIFLIMDLIYLIIAYGLYKKLPILDKISKLAFEFTVQVGGQFILLFIFTGIILTEIIYYIMGLIHFVYAAATIDYQQNIQLCYVYIFFSMWVIGTTLQIYKFCISWFFGKNEENNLLDTIKMSVRHIGSLSLSTLVCMFFGVIVSCLKKVETLFNICLCFCISMLIKACRKSIEKLISSLTLVRIAHSGDNYCQSMKLMAEQLAKEPFYFLFVIWGADLVSSIIGFLSFLGGLLIGLVIVFSESEIFTQTFAIILFFILIWTVASEVSDLFTTNYRMVLYSIGTYYDLCSKYKAGVLIEKFKHTNEQLILANKDSNLKVKDIS